MYQMRLILCFVSLSLSSLVNATDYGRPDWEIDFLNQVINSDLKIYAIEIEYSVSDDCQIIVNNFYEHSKVSLTDDVLKKKIIARYLGPYSQEREFFELPVNDQGKLSNEPVRNLEKISRIKWRTQDSTHIECFFSKKGLFSYADYVKVGNKKLSRSRIKSTLSELKTRKWKLRLK